MHTVSWIENGGILESVTTPSLERAITIYTALSILYRSVRIWKQGKLII